MVANYDCIIRTDASPANQAHGVLYGHGLLGDASEVDLAPQRAMVKRFNYAYCATDWKGMATEDVPNVGLILNDLSRFPTLTDRMQQGLLNFLYLGRLLRKGFPNEPGLAGRIDTSALFYDGNSQGGIYGGTLTAVAPDFQRAVLGVPAMNYSTLLQRSTDFSQYATVLSTSYPDELQRPLLFSLLQQLWDRSDPNGYAQHMTTDPYPNTPSHTVLMQSAVGDHQVANVAADVEARTIGAKLRGNPVDAGRSNDVRPFYAIPRTSFPTSGSLYEPWDAGAGSTRWRRTPTPRRSTPRRTRTRTASRAARRPPRTRRPSTCAAAGRSPTSATTAPATASRSAHSGLKKPTKPAPPIARSARSSRARRMSRCAKPLAS